MELWHVSATKGLTCHARWNKEIIRSSSQIYHFPIYRLASSPAPQQQAVARKRQSADRNCRRVIDAWRSNPGRSHTGDVLESGTGSDRATSGRRGGWWRIWYPSERSWGPGYWGRRQEGRGWAECGRRSGFRFLDRLILEILDEARAWYWEVIRAQHGFPGKRIRSLAVAADQVEFLGRWRVCKKETRRLYETTPNATGNLRPWKLQENIVIRKCRLFNQHY